MLEDLFATPIHDYNAEQIDDYLTPSLVPTVVLMNPPFCASPNMVSRNALATWNHLYSAIARLAPGGRLVAISANWFSPFNPKWKDYFERIQQAARVVFSAGIEGTAYSKHGTNIETRLTVFDKVPASDSQKFLNSYPSLLSLSELKDYIKLYVPSRAIAIATINTNGEKITIANNNAIASQKQRRQDKTASTENWGEIVELNHSIRDWQSNETELIEGIYEPYQPQVIAIVGAADHPTPLVQSVAMASVAPPQPSYRPLLPERAIGEGLLSAIQLESVIYAGEAHQNYLKGLRMQLCEPKPDKAKFREWSN
jgi:P-loop containing NTP hydrolase pore-1